MSWVTVLCSAVAATCLTLSGVHAVIWMRDRASRANLGFSILAFGVALFAWTELATMRATTPEAYASALRWVHVPIFLMVVGIVSVVWFHFGTARPWLGHLSWGVRAIVLVANFVRPYTIDFDQLSGVRYARFLGEQVAVTAGDPGLWHVIGQISLWFVLAFVVDASVTLWRRGDHESKRRAIVFGASSAWFVSLGAGWSLLVFHGKLAAPHAEFVFFIPVVCAMAYELSRDVLRAAALGRSLQVSESALRETERRMTMAADAARLGMWIWDMDTGSLWATAKMRDLFGFSAEETVSREMFLERVHPLDRAATELAIDRAIDTLRPVEVTCRVVRPDGSVRWIAGHGRVELDESSRPRLLGVCMDISEQRMAELAAHELSGRLINAQEDERRRIARDLHDDLSQRLALLSVEMEILSRDETATGRNPRAAQIVDQIRDLSNEIHKLSYQLHPAKLDQLGLVTAARSWCREITLQSGVAIEFASRDVPGDLPPDVALCLYRIIQESSRNVVRHSHAPRAIVDLACDGLALRLVIRDTGQGFDVAAAGGHSGLGLLGMQERVRLVKGTVSVRSTPGAGTEVEAIVPLSVGSSA